MKRTASAPGQRCTPWAHDPSVWVDARHQITIDAQITVDYTLIGKRDPTIAVHSDKLGMQTRTTCTSWLLTWHSNIPCTVTKQSDFEKLLELRLPHKYCGCHKKCCASLIVVTYETSFTMRGATGITLQPHQILRLPRKMSVMHDVRHIWNVIYTAQSNRHHTPTSPNTAPATQNASHAWCPSHMKRHLHCAKQQASHCNLTKYCACHAKWVSCMMSVTYETSFTMRGATGISLQPHQIVRLPHKMNLMHDVHHIWNVIYNARSNRHHPPTSPNTAPATQNESHSWCPSHMKRHLQCAEQQASPFNLTKCCACHAKWQSKI